MKNLHFIKIFLISFIFSILVVGHCSAKVTDGYIITTDLDTIHGIIKINKFNPYSGGYLIVGFDLESYHSRVAFKGSNDRRFQFYEPKDILGFGFEFNSIDYRFKSFNIEKQSIYKEERTYQRFLQLIYNGQLALYRDVIKIQMWKFNHLIPCDAYYIYNDFVGINEVGTTRKMRTLKSLLALYHVDQEFLNSINSKTKNKDIYNILMEYDIWLNKR